MRQSLDSGFGTGSTEKGKTEVDWSSLFDHDFELPKLTKPSSDALCDLVLVNSFEPPVTGKNDEVVKAKDDRIIFTTGDTEDSKPRKVIFRNKSSIEFQYNDAQELKEATIKDDCGKPICKIKLVDGSYLLQRDKIILKAKFDDLTVAANGDMSFKPDGDVRKSMRFSNGEIVTDFQASPTSKIMQRVEDAGQLDRIKSYEIDDRGRRLSYQKFPDGRELTFGYEEKDGTFTLTSIQDQVNQSMSIFKKVGPDNRWTKVGFQSKQRFNPIAGSLELDENSLPVFQPFDRSIDSGTDRMKETRLEMVQLSALAERVQKLIDPIAKIMFQPQREAIEKEFIQKTEETQKCKWNELLPERRERFTKELDKKIEEAYLEKLKSLKTALDEEIRTTRKSDKIDNCWVNMNVTRDCLNVLDKWLDNSLVPIALKQGRSLGEIKANCPVPSPKHPHQEQFVASSTMVMRDLEKLAASGSIHFNKNRIPSEQDVDKLEKKIAWCEETLEQAGRERTRFELYVLLPRVAKMYGLPEKAFAEPCASDEAKLERIRKRMEMQMRVKELAHSIKAVKSYQKDMNIPLPPNCTENADGSLSFKWTEGRRMSDRVNKIQDKALTDWLLKYGPKFEALMQQCADAVKSPDKRILYGDIPGKGFAVFDKDGRFQDVMDEPGPGRREINLLSGSFDVDEKNGKYTINMQWQPKYSGSFDYLDLTADKVGHPSIKSIGPLDGKDLIAVFDSHMQLRIIPVEEAKNWRRGQCATYWGLKATNLFMDVAFTAAAISSGGMALAGRLGLRAVMGAVWKGTLGISGFVTNNAKFHSDPANKELLQLRSTAMFFDISHGLFSSCKHLVKGGRALTEAEKGARLAVDDLSALFRVPIKQSTNFVEGRTHSILMKGSSLFFLPVVSSDLNHQINKMMGRKDKTYEEARKVADLKKLNLQDDSKLLDELDKRAKAQSKLTVAGNSFSMILSQSQLKPGDRKKIEEIAKEVITVLEDTGENSVEGQRKSEAEKCRQRLLAITQEPNDVSVRLAASLGLLFVEDENGKDQSAGILAVNSKGRLTRDDLVARLEFVANGKSPELQMVAADLLVRLEKRTPFDLAITMRDTIENPEATVEARAYAIANLTHFIKTEEAAHTVLLPNLDSEGRSQYLAQSAGLSASDVSLFLKRIACDKSLAPDLRTFTTRALMLANENQTGESLQSKLNKELGLFTETTSSEPGKYNSVVVTQLEAKSDSKNLTERLRALRGLSDLGELGSFKGADGAKVCNTKLIGLFEEIRLQKGVDADLAIQVVEALKLERPDSLDENGRKQLLAFLEHPVDKELQAVKLAIVTRARDLSGNSKPWPEFNKAVTALIDLRLGNALYAKDSTDLRLACIAALRLLRVDEADGRVVLSKLAAPPEPGQCKLLESDARVRLAALSALQEIGAGRDFDTSLEKSLLGETDVAVRIFAEGAKLKSYRPVRDFLYFQSRDILAAEIATNQKYNISNGKIYLDTLSGAVKEIPMTERVAAIVLKPRVIKYDLSTGMELDPPRTVMERYKGEIDIYNKQRVKFFETELFQKALTGNENQDKSIQALVWIVMNKDHDLLKNADQKKMLFDKSVDVLLSLCKPGSGAGEAVQARVKSIVASTEVPADLRLKFLKALDEQVKCAPNQRDSTYGKYLSDVLERDLAGTVNQPGKDDAEGKARTELRSFILNRTKELKTPFALRVLDGISVSDLDLQGVRDQAQTILADWRDSVRVRWDDMPKSGSNGAASEDNAAQEIVRALVSSNGNLDHTVNSILRGGKMKPILSGDPRISAINLALKAKSQPKSIEVAASELGLKLSDSSAQIPEALKKKLENGTEMIRLAAALVILDGANSGFSDDEKRDALRICAELAWDGCEFGYRRDAKIMLESQIKAGNPLALQAVADMVLSRTGSVKEAYKLLQDSFKQDLSVTQLPGNRQLVLRATRDGVVVEEFKDGLMLRAAVAPVKNYAEVLIEDMRLEKDFQKRFTIAQVILADANPQYLFANEDQRRRVVQDVLSWSRSYAGSRVPSELRSACANYLACLKGQNAEIAKPMKREIIASILDLAVNSDQLSQDYLDSLPPPERFFALGELIDRKPLTNRIAESLEKSNAQTVERILKDVRDPKEREQIKKAFEERMAAYKQVDKPKMDEWLNVAATLAKTSTPSPANDALTLAAYFQAAEILGCEHPLLAELKVEKCIERLRTMPAKTGEPDLRYLLFQPGKALPELTAKEPTTEEKLAMVAKKVLQSKDVNLLKQYKMLCEAMVPNAVAGWQGDVLETYERVLKAGNDEPVQAFDAVALRIKESLDRQPAGKADDSEKRYKMIETFFAKAPLASRLKLAESLLGSSQKPLRYLAFRAVAQGLQSHDHELRARANTLMEGNERSCPSDKDTALNAILSEPSSGGVHQDYYKWIVKLAENDSNPEMKKLVEALKKQLK